MNLFITAALGSQSILGAAKRLEKQAQATKLFAQTVIVTESDLLDICPHLFDWYTPEELNSTPGFGYFIWKSAIANAATQGYWGNYSTVVFLDAGCEIVPGGRSSSLMRRLIAKSESNGAVVFSTGCPEWQYTKPSVWSHFKHLSPLDSSDQLMGGIWILSGERGAQIADKWNSYVALSPEMTNDFVDQLPTGFVAPRHDQSIFSLVLKTFGVVPESEFPPFPRNTFLSKLLALRYPIWAARNRSSLSTITLPLKVISYLVPSKFGR